MIKVIHTLYEYAISCNSSSAGAQKGPGLLDAPALYRCSSWWRYRVNFSRRALPGGLSLSILLILPQEISLPLADAPDVFSQISSREVSLPRRVGRHAGPSYRGDLLYRGGLLYGLSALRHVPCTSLLASLRERLHRACLLELLTVTSRTLALQSLKRPNL